ncbi:hypothetical protein PPYR_04081 [Photinus pyralis]|uniref:Uncharacterized protein n=2 Tax=Photinus pyralis TaxID=7054 RepID=A0A1Y1JYJ8_PHOPY|nr:serine/threonine-protein kinase 11-interacting protein-like [Photinus pyralis]KAB0801895.1 hypothetical protein PPYR_04081 [Photinus pyralis]
MDYNEIYQLAAILRESGDKVLDCSSKLSLSSNLLCMLNSSFVLLSEQRDVFNSSFQVLNNTNINTEIFRDLQFLYDFIQRSVSLKLINDTLVNSINDAVDITKFKNLRFLELQKVDVTSIIGLQTVRTQLQYLICVRSISSIKNVLEKCGGDESEGFVWCELKEATFSHNKLKEIDSSLELVPWLHTLDLSYNMIKDARPLNCLPNLKYINLSYNHLEVAPSFTGQICTRIQVLGLSNNFIEDVWELTALTNLCELDLSNNCLLKHESLAPLSSLAALQWLNLEGNPLSFHPHHRRRTAQLLHINTGTVRFLLDRTLLSKEERRMVGSVPLITHSLQRSYVSSFCSNVSEHTVIASERPHRVRSATIISESNQDSTLENSFASVTSLLASVDHLDTKNKIEQLRREYGEAWLQSQGGAALLQDALGLERTKIPLSSSPYAKEFLLHAKDTKLSEKTEVLSEKSTNNTFTTATDSVASENNSLYAGEQVDSSEVVVSEEEEDDDDEELGEGEENLYLANLKDSLEPIFIVLTNTHIFERECDTSKEKTRWLLETLQSCELLGDDCTDIRLTFDTVKRDRREREYVLEADESTRLSCVLNNILTNRSPLEQLIVYQCMKCSTQFSNKKKRGRSTPVLECPACHSTVVIEHDENE